MNIACPNNLCKSTISIQKDGHYYRRDDSKCIQRFRCTSCGRKFSNSTFCLTYRQKKRRHNSMLAKLLASGVSMRRCALLLNFNRKTVERKFEYLAKVSEQKQQRMLEKVKAEPVTHLQFDDLITSEHTKLKPLSVSIAVCAHTRVILGAEVSQIPAFGHLAEISRKKYGRRKSEHKKGLTRLFESIKPLVSPTSLIRSDEHNFYPEFVARYFPQAKHQRFKGARGSVVGQGELKKLARDPLFMLNHTCAMFRANINRLIRKTWCTTKKAQNLQKHINIYMCFHNETLIGGFL